MAPKKYKYYKYILLSIIILFIILVLYNIQINKEGYEDLNNKILIIICSKSPNPLLYECIDKLYKIQIKNNKNYKICVVDSDSSDLTNYDKVKKNYPDVDINFVKNKNYEYGAWKYGLTKYPDYNIYFCIQDTLIINKFIDISIVNDSNAYIWHSYNGYNGHISIKEKGINNLKNSDLDYHSIVHTDFTFATHSSFIVSNKTMNDIFLTLKEPPVDKDGACFYERNFGLYFIIKKIITHNLNDFMDKTNGKRT
jgi:hypothetical protein